MSDRQMEWPSRFDNIEEVIVKDGNFLSTMVSFAMVLIVFLNQVAFHSMIVGIASSLVWFSLNAILLGHVFFEKETSLLRLVLGGLFLLMFLGVVGWIMMIAYNIDITGSTIALYITAALCSAMNKMKTKS